MGGYNFDKREPDTEEQMIEAFLEKKIKEGKDVCEIVEKIERRMPHKTAMIPKILETIKYPSGERKIISRQVMPNQIGELLAGSVVVLLLLFSLIFSYNSLVNLRSISKNTTQIGLTEPTLKTGQTTLY